MRTKNLLKLALTMVAMLTITGAWAQTIANYTGNYVDANNLTDNNISLVTVGKSIPLFVWPSTLYHPSYNPVDGSGMTADFTWVWTSGTPANVTLGSQNLNYVEATAVGAVGSSSVINVKEKAPAAWGGCEDPTGTDITVTIVAKPTYSLAGAGTTANYCSGNGSIPTAGPEVTFTGYVNFDFTYTLEIKTIDQNGTAVNYYDIDKANPNAVAYFASNYTKGTPATATALTANLAYPTGGYTLIDANTSTVYTYTMALVNDVVSRKSDFLANPTKVKANFEYYDNAGAVDGAAVSTFAIIIRPAPVTGPIFHIPNAWSN